MELENDIRDLYIAEIMDEEDGTTYNYENKLVDIEVKYRNKIADLIGEVGVVFGD